MKKTFLMCCATLILSGCNPLSERARQMTGDYFILELSNGEPILSLKDDGSCVVTAIKPNVLTYSVEGDWNVENDSIVIDLDPARLSWEGDSTLIADIPAHLSYHIVSYNELTLEVEHDGVVFSLHRRVKSKD